MSHWSFPLLGLEMMGTQPCVPRERGQHGMGHLYPGLRVCLLSETQKQTLTSGTLADPDHCPLSRSHHTQPSAALSPCQDTWVSDIHTPASWSDTAPRGQTLVLLKTKLSCPDGGLLTGQSIKAGLWSQNVRREQQLRYERKKSHLGEDTMGKRVQRKTVTRLRPSQYISMKPVR